VAEVTDIFRKGGKNKKNIINFTKNKKMPKSTSSSNSIMALIYNAVAWANIADNASAAPLTDISIALATASGAVADTMATNIATYTNYVGQVVARSVAGWTAPSGGAVSNVAQITFPQCGVTGNTITSAKTGVGLGAVAVLHYGDLNAPITVSNLIQPVFAIGAVTITES